MTGSATLTYSNLTLDQAARIAQIVAGELGSRAETLNSHHVGRVTDAQRQGAVAAQAPIQQDGSAIGEVKGKARLPNAVGVEPLPSSQPARKPAGDPAADNGDKGRGHPAGGAEHFTNEAGPHISGGSDGNRSTPSSSAGGAKMDEGASPNPGQSDADASGNHCTKEEQAVAPIRRPVSFRPHCQNPNLCASGTRDHCHSCKRAMAQSEAA